jgi:hypothetical protein
MITTTYDTNVIAGLAIPGLMGESRHHATHPLQQTTAPIVARTLSAIAPKLIGSDAREILLLLEGRFRVTRMNNRCFFEIAGHLGSFAAVGTEKLILCTYR